MKYMGNTYFFNFDNADQRFGSLDGILPITLYKGMKITIHGFELPFLVESWCYHLGHSDENAGLRIYLKPFA